MDKRMLYLFVLFIFSLSSPLCARIPSEICDQLLIEHTADSNVEYKSDVLDVEGNPMIPPDLEGGIVINPPKSIKIPLKFNLNQFFLQNGTGNEAGVFTEGAEIGTLFFQEGRLFFNDQPLYNEQVEKIRQHCLLIRGEK